MEKVTLRPITLSYTDNIVKWRNSDAVRLNMLNQRFLTEEQHRNYFRARIETYQISQFIIEVNNIPIGTIFSKELDAYSCEIGLFIGEAEYRNKTYGTQALNYLLRWIKELGIYKDVYIKVKKQNLIAVNLYKKLGFCFTGVNIMCDFYIMKKDV